MHVRNAVLSLAALVSSVAVPHLWISPLRADGQQPVQTFRSGRELLTIDASVRTPDGKPITDLQPSDFTVRIDGQPRQVFAARLYAPPAPASTADAHATLPSSRFARVVDNPPGRVVVIAVDRTSIRAGGEMATLKTAADLIGKLAPSDAVGAIGLPAGAIEPTRDHAAVVDFVRRMTGAAPLSDFGGAFDAHHISWEEALAYERSDKRTIATVVERECPKELPLLSGMPLISCPDDLKTLAGQMLVVGRAQAQAMLANLSNVLGNLAPLRAPKHLVLLSGGIPFDAELLSRYQELADKAAESHVALSIVHLHQALDTMERKTLSNVFGGQEYESGLGTIASMTGGSFYTATGASTGLFDRIATDINYVYELGVESTPADPDGKPHRVEVKVSRPGASVMAPAKTASTPPSADAEAAITRALSQPTDIPELPLEVAPYLTHSTDPDKVRVIVAATLGDATVVPSQWGYVILDGRKIVAGSHVHVSSTLTGPWAAQLSTDVDSGRYRLRAAAVSPDGRLGVVEIPLQVGMRASGSMQTSDLVVGTVQDGRLQPAPQVRQDEAGLGMIELSSSEALTDAAATLQLTPVDGTAPVMQAPMKLRTRADDKTVIVAEAALDLRAVPPGTYAASAVLTRGGAAVSRVSRMVTIAPGAEKATPVAPAPAPPAAAAFKTEPGAKPSSSEAAALMEHVASYVADYGTRASVIIAVEHYKQDASSVGSAAPSFAPIRGTTRGDPPPVPTGTGDVQTRTQSGKLVSELALVRNEKQVGGWVAFRDVIEVNGKPVPDRKDRLQRVLSGSAPDLEIARQITNDNARYNIGGSVRTYNVPTATLFFFTPRNLGRFTYVLAGSEKVDGVTATKIEFHETARPSMIVTTTGHDVFSRGFLWVDAADGSVLRTQMNIEGYANSSSRAVVEVFYHREEAMDMLLPSRMTERYDGIATRITSEATYSDFKRFQTSATVKVK